MASFSKIELSGSTDGRGIKIVATATPGTTLHTAQAGTGADNYDEIWLYLVNSQAGSVKVTLEFGGTTSPDDLIEMTIQGEAGLVLVLPGLVLQNSLVLKAFADTANVVMAHGWVNRITA